MRLIDSSTPRASTPSTGTNNTSSRLSHTPPPYAVGGGTTTTTAPPFSKNPRPRPHNLDPPELLESLSLSSAPIPLRTRHASGPVFGHPSLRPPTFFRSHPPPSPSPPPPPSQSRDAEMDEEDGEDAMDWMPTATSTSATAPVRLEPAASRGLGLLPTRKAQDATTGLEMLLERTNIVDSSEQARSMSFRARQKGGANSSWSWGWVYALSLIPLVGVMYYHLLQ